MEYIKFRKKILLQQHLKHLKMAIAPSIQPSFTKMNEVLGKQLKIAEFPVKNYLLQRKFGIVIKVTQRRWKLLKKVWTKIGRASCRERVKRRDGVREVR